MPRFMFTFCLLLAVSAASLAGLVFTTAPSQPNLIIFFTLLFLFLFSFLAIIFYLLTARQAREPLNRRGRFKEALKTSAILSLLVVVTGGLKVFQALNPVNFLLLTLVLLVLFFYLKR